MRSPRVEPIGHWVMDDCLRVVDECRVQVCEGRGHNEVARNPSSGIEAEILLRIERTPARIELVDAVCQFLDLVRIKRIDRDSPRLPGQFSSTSRIDG